MLQQKLGHRRNLSAAPSMTAAGPVGGEIVSSAAAA